MREKVTVIDPATALMRLLDALADELIEASDEEIMQAAKDLGMNPRMPGSAAFAGLKFRVKPRLSDFYDLDLDPNLPSASKWWAARLSKDADEES
jgi:hypothetical protein